MSAASAALDALLERCLNPSHPASVGRMARRLLHVVEPTGQAPRTGLGAPLGVSGFHMRGPWERLLHSEWALADEVPIEFLRRAADRELRFSELERERPRPPEVLEVRFDSGPSCLGRPRVVQVAVLLACAAQAAAHGLEYRWGSLQQDDLHTGIPDSWLADFRALRSLCPAASPGPVPERTQRWLVSTAALRMPGNSLQLTHDNDHWHAVVGNRRVPLGPLSDGPGAWLLRGRQEPVHRGKGLRWPQAQGMFFSPSGARLFCWSADRGTVYALPVPPRPGRKTHVLRVPGTALAVGWVKQKLTALSMRGDDLFLCRKDRLLQLTGQASRARPGAPMRLLARLARPPDDEGVWVLPVPPVELEAHSAALVDGRQLDGARIRWSGTLQRGDDDDHRVVARTASGELVAGEQSGRLRFDQRTGGAIHRPTLLCLAPGRVWAFHRSRQGWWSYAHDTHRFSGHTVELPGLPLGVIRVAPHKHLAVVHQGGAVVGIPLEQPGRPQQLRPTVAAVAVSPTAPILATREHAGSIDLRQISPPAQLGRWDPP